MIEGTAEGTVEGMVKEIVTSFKLTSCTTLKNKKGTAEGTAEGTVKDTACTPFIGDNLTTEQKRYNGWLAFTKEKTPYVVSNIGQLTYDQFTKLRERFGNSPMSEIIQQIENRKDLRKRYSSLYLTMFNWLKRNYENEK